MAQSKRNQLLERVKETAPRPNPSRLADAENQPRGYRVVPASLYTPEANWVDQLTEALKRAGNPKANRSMVIREAIFSLQKDLEGKTDEEVLQYFIARHRKA